VKHLPTRLLLVMLRSKLHVEAWLTPLFIRGYMCTLSMPGNKWGTVLVLGV
jgi:hypothetical protein